MSIIAEFTVESEDFALAHSLAAAPEMIVEIERVVATLHDRIMPYFWVSGDDQTDFETAFRADDTVQNIVAIDAVDDARLYRAEWTSNVETIVYAYVEVGATILEAIGTRWILGTSNALRRPRQTLRVPRVLRRERNLV